MELKINSAFICPLLQHLFTLILVNSFNYSLQNSAKNRLKNSYENFVHKFKTYS